MESKGVPRVALYGEHLAGAFQEFCRAVWPRSFRPLPSAPAVAAVESTPDRKTSDTPTFLFLKDEKVVGHVATIPVRLSTVSGVIMPAHWIVGFMVLPEYRNGLVGPLLIKEVNRVLNCAMSLHVEPPVLRILTGLRWIHRGVLPQYLYVLAPSAVMENLHLSVVESMHCERKRSSFFMFSLKNRGVRWIGGLGLTFGQRMWRGLTSVTRPTFAYGDVRAEFSFDTSYTELWLSVAGQFGATLVRDQAALQARFGPKLELYRLLTFRKHHKLLGYCILKLKQFSNDARMGNMKVGTIVDCLFDPRQSSVFHCLIAEAIRWLRQERAHVVLCTASFRAIRRLLIQNGFFSIPGNLNFAYHVQSSQGLEAIPLESWHLMRGDSDADQNF